MLRGRLCHGAEPSIWPSMQLVDFLEQKTIIIHWDRVALFQKENKFKIPHKISPRHRSVVAVCEPADLGCCCCCCCGIAVAWIWGKFPLDILLDGTASLLTCAILLPAEIVTLMFELEWLLLSLLLLWKYLLLLLSLRSATLTNKNAKLRFFTFSNCFPCQFT